ncbi:MAG: hypothetical protein ACRDVM_01885 [Acidimicrobiia bacterium]
MLEVVELIELKSEPGSPVHEEVLGTFELESDAVEVARTARATFRAGGREDYAWWVVRKPGARLAQWIADSHSEREFVLDLTTGQLIDVE